MAAEVVKLLSQENKLFAIYRHVNLLCIRSTLLDDTPGNDSVLFKLLSRFFSSIDYNKPCTTPDLTEQEQLPLLSLLAEYVSLQILHTDPPDYFVGWELGEALEFYLENFKGRNSEVVELLSDGGKFKVDHVGYLMHSLVQG